MGDVDFRAFLDRVDIGDVTANISGIGPIDPAQLAYFLPGPLRGISIVTSAPAKFSINLETGVITMIDSCSEMVDAYIACTNIVGGLLKPVVGKDKPRHPKQHYLNMRSRWAK